MEFNFEAKSYDKLCGITKMRGAEIAGILTLAREEILENYQQYTHAEGEKVGLAKGKVLHRFFEVITDEKERCVVMFAFDHIMDSLCSDVSRKKLRDTLRETVDQMKNELFGNKKPQP
jgi:hypothetical protein